MDGDDSGQVRCAVLGEPLSAHPAEIGRLDAGGRPGVVEHHGATGGNEKGQSEQQHGLDETGPPVRVMMVPNRGALVCALLHISSRREHDPRAHTPETVA